MSFTESLEDLVARNPNGLLSAHATWSRVPLNLVFDVQNGFPFESRHFNPSAEGMPLLRIRDIVPGSTGTYYSDKFDRAFVVNRSDIVVGMDGDFECRAWRGAPALLNQRVCRLRPKSDRYSTALLAHVLQGYLDAINAKTSAITVKHLSSRTIEDIPLPLPPREEQGRIVEAIDSHLSRLDDAVTSLERVQVKLKSYRASVLRAAVEGRLVPTEASLARAENRAYEPAGALLARMLKERRRRWEETELARLKAAGKTPKDDKWKAKYDEPVAPDTGTLPELPEGWCWVSLDQLLAEPLANGKSVPDGNGAPVLRLTCIKNGLVDLTERKSGEWNDIDPRRFLVEADDFLIIRGNGSKHLVGRGGRVSTAPDGVAYPDTLIRARADNSVLHPPLLAFWWDSPPVRQHIERRAKTTAGIYKVNQTDLGQTPVPLAPMLEQTRIYDELERLNTTAFAATSTIEADVRRCSRLRQAVLKWAFEGKLVDQDPNEEPAEMLLARIRAERAADAPLKNGGRRAKGAA